MPGTLYVVSTPIGNLDDITLRGLETLKSVGLIAAEDTRRTATLLRHFGINTPTTSLHKHNERQKLAQLLQKLEEGVDVALVSDAGTPLVADPGQRLVAAATDRGVRIVPIPGASAVLSALTASGFAADEFVFGGFAPSRAKDRKRWLTQFRDDPRPVVFFETPHRIDATLADMAAELVERPIIVARELTKLHEEIIRTTAGTAKELPFTRKGEFTIVLGPLPKQGPVPVQPEASSIAAFFSQMTNFGAGSRREAIDETAKHFNLSRNQVYALLERAKSGWTP